MWLDGGDWGKYLIKSVIATHEYALTDIEILSDVARYKKIKVNVSELITITEIIKWMLIIFNHILFSPEANSFVIKWEHSFFKSQYTNDEKKSSNDI